MPILLLFIIIPLAEVYAFINVGEEIGVLKTLLLCVATAIIGGTLVKMQGIETLMKAQKNFSAGTLPVNELFDGLCLVIAGALLLTPGFVTDTVGFALLVPPLRAVLRGFLAKHNKFNMGASSTSRPSPSNPDDIIEGDYEHIQKEKKKLDQEKLD